MRVSPAVFERLTPVAGTSNDSVIAARQVADLPEFLDQVPDPRARRGVRHSPGSLPAAAALAGRQTFAASRTGRTGSATPPTAKTTPKHEPAPHHGLARNPAISTLRQHGWANIAHGQRHASLPVSTDEKAGQALAVDN
jgi:hypothetical protein